MGFSIKFVLAALPAVLLAGSAWADTVTVSESFARLRRQPAPSGRAIGLVYGNDALKVLKKAPGWYRVRTRRGVVGWVAADALRPPHLAPAGPAAPPAAAKPAPAPAKTSARTVTPGERKPAPPASLVRREALEKGRSLQLLGYRAQARQELLDVVRNHPGTPEFYRAVRYLLYYHPVGELPKAGASVSRDAMEQARRLAADILADAENS